MNLNSNLTMQANKKTNIKSKWKKREERLRNVRQEYDKMNELRNRILDVDTSLVEKFSDLPLSERSQNGLKSCGYVNPTEIQRQGIPVALKGHDVLGTAETGSGKTLAFLIPVLECLWHLKWSSVDGLGALIISPTRELAYQTFEVLCKIGKHHDISAGLIIGGKELSFEQQRIQKTNIIVCTPGRLLQHMDETPNFDCSTLKILVLDEADRILDMGFSETVNAIIENLPEGRQTLLYSATQTSSVSDLARLSLHEPQYVSAHKNSEVSTPQELKQSYVVCELQDKVSFLYSFIKNHLKNKILVFLSSCKQVKFTYEAFRRLRPGVPLMALYGKQNQIKRVAIYNDFCRKTSAVLLATDIAARGLDFPSVHWVIQLDCPEDANTYIHRAGRTARYQRGGHSLLMLLPSEEKGMLEELERKKVPITEIKANPKKLHSIQKKLEGLCAEDRNIKQWAQKSVVSYVRSVYLQSNKKVFNVEELPIAKYSISLGLLVPPRIRFLQKAQKKHGFIPKNQETDGNQPLLEGIFSKKHEETEADQDFLILHEKNVDIPSDSEEDCLDEVREAKIKTKISSVKKVLKKKIKVNSKVLFNDQGEPVPVDLMDYNSEESSLSHLQPVSFEDSVNLSKTGGLDMKQASLKLGKQEKQDRLEFQDKVKQRHREKRKKDKLKRKHSLEDDDEIRVTLRKPEVDEHLATEDIESKKSYRLNYKQTRHKRDIENEELTSTTLEDDEDLALKLLAN